MDTAREYGFARRHYASESLACVVLLFTRPVMERRQDAIEQRNEHEKARVSKSRRHKNNGSTAEDD